MNFSLASLKCGRFWLWLVQSADVFDFDLFQLRTLFTLPCTNPDNFDFGLIQLSTFLRWSDITADSIKYDLLQLQTFLTLSSSKLWLFELWPEWFCLAFLNLEFLYFEMDVFYFKLFQLRTFWTLACSNCRRFLLWPDPTSDAITFDLIQLQMILTLACSKFERFLLCPVPTGDDFYIFLLQLWIILTLAWMFFTLTCSNSGWFWLWPVPIADVFDFDLFWRKPFWLLSITTRNFLPVTCSDGFDYSFVETVSNWKKKIILRIVQNLVIKFWVCHFLDTDPKLKIQFPIFGSQPKIFGPDAGPV